MQQYVISLYDYTGEALKPWAEAGYTCHAYDIQHDEASLVDRFEGGGSISFHKADLHDYKTLNAIFYAFTDRSVAFGMAFPVCTDLAVSGAAWFKKKAEADPLFQQRAAQHAIDCAGLFDDLGCPYFIENPVSVLATKWRKPDHTFHPYEYGGYIAKNDAQHPRWPDYIADRDAYPKKTCLWTGNGFVMPPKVPVEPESGHSRQHLKLGGKSAKTKNIRSATPRGFAIAVMAANTQKDTSNGNQDRSRQAVQDTDLLVS
jgi:hypothetical protein